MYVYIYNYIYISWCFQNPKVARWPPQINPNNKTLTTCWCWDHTIPLQPKNKQIYRHVGWSQPGSMSYVSSFWGPNAEVYCWAKGLKNGIPNMSCLSLQFKAGIIFDSESHIVNPKIRFYPDCCLNTPFQYSIPLLHTLVRYGGFLKWWYPQSSSIWFSDFPL